MKFDKDLVQRVATLTYDDVASLPHVHIPDSATLFQLMAWRNKNKELVRNFKAVVDEGVISVGSYLNLQYFNQKGADIFHMNKTTEKEYVAFSYNKDSWAVTPIANTISFHPADEVIQDMVTVHATVMAYLAHTQVAELHSGQIHRISGV